MNAIYHVFTLQRIKPKQESIEGSPYFYSPIFQSAANLPVGQQQLPELAPFDTEEAAIEYIEQHRNARDEFVIVKSYKSEK